MGYELSWEKTGCQKMLHHADLYKVWWHMGLGDFETAQNSCYQTDQNGHLPCQVMETGSYREKFQMIGLLKQQTWVAQTGTKQAPEVSEICLSSAKEAEPAGSISAEGGEWSCNLELWEMNTSWWGRCPVLHPFAEVSGETQQVLRYSGAARLTGCLPWWWVPPIHHYLMACCQVWQPFSPGSVVVCNFRRLHF